MRALGLGAAAAAVMAMGVVTAFATPGGVHVVDAQYFHDHGAGKHYNVLADLKGDPTVVFAKANGVEADGVRDNHVGPAAHTTSWFFRDRRFVRAVRADLAADGRAKIKVFAGLSNAGLLRTRCWLTAQFNPRYDQYAGGVCDPF
jgi:hypothetical protein